MSKDDFDVSDIIGAILNPKKEWQEIKEKVQDSSDTIRVKEIHISDKKKKKFVFPGNFVVRFEGEKLICSCE